MDKNQEPTQFEKDRTGAIVFADLVYAGAVLVATVLFISFVLTAFPEDAYASRAVLVIGGLLVGASMISFSNTLHKWAITGKHRSWALGLYYGEMVIIAVNTIASFSALLYEYAGMELPAWVAWYEPFSIASIVYTIFAWGTIRQLDPKSKELAEQRQAERETQAVEERAKREFDKRVAEKKMEFLDSIEGEDAIAMAAFEKIQRDFGVNAAPKGGHFGSGRNKVNNPVSPLLSKLPKLTLPAPRVYTLPELLEILGVDDAPRANELLDIYHLDTPEIAYDTLGGHLPPDMEFGNFRNLYFELRASRVAIRPVPVPAKPGGNGLNP